jgi:hypothetical protein
MIGFNDQEPNQLLAKEGSLTGSLATLDLSEASDRVSFQLVRTMFSRYPLLSEAIDVTRSMRAEVDGYGVIPLAKYASMGSALCFPIEAMVFLTIIFVGIEQSTNTQTSLKSIKRLMGRVRVYGDDIIVPVHYVHCVISELESFGMRVNASKSFWTGKFRESCGKEYYDGHDVTLSRVRRVFPTSRTDSEEIISLVSLRNQMFDSGMTKTVAWLDRTIERLIPFPYVGRASPVLGRFQYLGFHNTERIGPNLHDPQVKGMVVQSRIPVRKTDGNGALMKWFLKPGEDPFVAVDHLERSGRPASLTLKRRWCSAI